MSNIKRYEIVWSEYASMIVEIDHDQITDDVLHQINNFWTGAKQRAREEQGSVLNAVLKMLASICFTQVCYSNWNTKGLIDLFSDEGMNDGIEGWPKMDGTEGIRIVTCDAALFAPEDIHIDELGGAA